MSQWNGVKEQSPLDKVLKELREAKAEIAKLNKFWQEKLTGKGIENEKWERHMRDQLARQRRLINELIAHIHDNNPRVSS